MALSVALVGGILSMLIIQQQALANARAEQSLLQSRFSDLSAPRNVPVTVDAAARDRADLERLRGETTALRARMDEFSAQTQQLAATSLVHKPGGIPLGEVLRARDARDVGQATPAATMQTFLWAIFHGDTNRLAQLLVMDAKPDNKEAQSVSRRLSWKMLRLGFCTPFPERIYGTYRIYSIGTRALQRRGANRTVAALEAIVKPRTEI